MPRGSARSRVSAASEACRAGLDPRASPGGPTISRNHDSLVQIRTTNEEAPRSPTGRSSACPSDNPGELSRDPNESVSPRSLDDAARAGRAAARVPPSIETPGSVQRARIRRRARKPVVATDCAGADGADSNIAAVARARAYPGPVPAARRARPVERKGPRSAARRRGRERASRSSLPPNRARECRCPAHSLESKASSRRRARHDRRSLASSPPRDSRAPIRTSSVTTRTTSVAS